MDAYGYWFDEELRSTFWELEFFTFPLICWEALVVLVITGFWQTRQFVA
jgi:hypothetical protein